MVFFKQIGHLTHHGFATGSGIHQIIGEQNRKGLIAHHRLGTQHRMAQAQGFGLANVNAVNARRRNAADHRQELVFVLRFELTFQFIGFIEVIFNGPLASTRDKDHVGNACGCGLFHGVLNQRFIDDRQHFFGACLGRGKKTRAQASDRKDGFADFSRKLTHSVTLLETAL